MTRLGRLLGALGARELARRLGRSPGTVQRWAKSGRVPEAAADDLRSVDRRRAAARAAGRARKEQAEKKEKGRRAKEKARVEKSRLQRDKLEREKLERSKREKAAKAAEQKRRQEIAKREREQREVRERAQQEKREAAERAKHEAEARAKAVEEKRKADEKRKAAEAAQQKKAAEAAQQKKAREAREKKEKVKLESESERRWKRINEVDRRRKIIEEACRLLTSNRSIGEAIDVDEATIRRWMADPPLKSAAFDKLEKLVASIHTLAELMKQAGEIQKLPTVQAGHGRRTGRKTDGVYWTRTFMSFLDPHLLKQIETWMSGHKGHWPFWQGVAITSQYSLRSDLNFKDLSDKGTPERDYKTIFIQVGKAKWGDFAVDRPEPTGQRKSAKEAAADLTRRLRQKMDSGVVQVFVHGVTLFAYRRRSKEEEMQWSHLDRQERNEEWQAKKKGSKGKAKKAKKGPLRRK